MRLDNFVVAFTNTFFDKQGNGESKTASSKFTQPQFRLQRF